MPQASRSRKPPAELLNAALRDLLLASHAVDISDVRLRSEPDPDAWRAYLAAVGHEADMLARAERARHELAKTAPTAPAAGAPGAPSFK